MKLTLFLLAGASLCAWGLVNGWRTKTISFGSAPWMSNLSLAKQPVMFWTAMLVNLLGLIALGGMAYETWAQ